MKKINLIVLEVLNCAINKKKFKLDFEISEEDWTEVTQILIKNNLIGVAYDAKDMFEEQKPMDGLVENVWKSFAMRIGLQQSISRHSVSEVLRKAEEKGIKLLVIKGNAIALLYPNPKMRASCDADLFVNIEDKEAAIEVLTSCGYHFIEKGSKENVPVYVKDKVSKIELHNCLWEDYKSELTDKLDSFRLTDEKTIVSMQDGADRFYTLGYEEHLVFQIFHIAKHFSLEGVGLKYICDLSLYVNRYEKEINWTSFWKKMKILHYDLFCDALFKIAIEYMGMTSKVLNRKYSNRVVDEDLIEDIIIIGKIGDNDQQPWRAMDKLMPFFLQESKVPVTRAEKFRSALFPSQMELSDYYTYAKKNKALVPVAWIHRIFHSIHYKLNPTLDKETLELKSDKVEHRMDLMNKAGLNK